MSSSNLRDLMESITRIEEGDDAKSTDAGETSVEIIKSIIRDLKNISARVVNQDVDDEDTLRDDLRAVRDSLHEIAGEETHSEDRHEEEDEGHDPFDFKKK